jgi:hypothetical protein
MGLAIVVLGAIFANGTGPMRLCVSVEYDGGLAIGIPRGSAV